MRRLLVIGITIGFICLAVQAAIIITTGDFSSYMEHWNNNS